MKNFLLRFEEEHVQENWNGDEDFSISTRKCDLSNETNSTIIAGTQTLTKIRQEGSDNDPGVSQLHALPK